MRLQVSDHLISYSAELLAQTEYGMTWTQIAKFFRKKSAEYNVAVPYVNTMFPSHLLNRRDGFLENLRAFSPEQQLILLKELCETNKKINITPLKKMLMHYYLKGGLPFM
ncbi:MAG: hypothetical protein C0490_09505 [Marivirga sp.]|nr:hypothetical protein [Marivirga sp.]